MTRRRIKFTNKQHPWKGKASLILGVISLISMGCVIYLSFRAGGMTRPGYGLTGLLSACFTLTGFILGVLALRERDSYRITGFLGSIVNLAVLILTAFLFSIGL